MSCTNKKAVETQHCPFPDIMCGKCEYESANAKPTFYMLFVEGRTAPTYKHTTEADAKIEAERLAQLPANIGRKVYLLKAILSCVVETPVKWSDL